MSTRLNTIFGPYESPQDGITVRDIGGHGHSCRRTFALVSPDKGTIGSVDIQSSNGPKLKQQITSLLERTGFKPVEQSLT